MPGNCHRGIDSLLHIGVMELVDPVAQGAIVVRRLRGSRRAQQATDDERDDE
jgi:hypothetical protein